MGEHSGQSYRGWLAGANGVAHYFEGTPTSICHRWLQTTIDAPLRESPDARKCSECVEQVGFSDG